MLTVGPVARCHRAFSLTGAQGVNQGPSMQ